MLRLSMLGWTQQEISDKLQELWPDAKGTSRVTVTETLSENGNSGFSTQILDALDHPPAKVAKMNNLPEIVVWGMRLKDLDDQAK
jgi:hypothetical protein